MRKIILIVEDSIADRTIIEHAFQKISPEHKLIFLNNGKEALDYLKSESNPVPFIIISDMDMPVLNGLELMSIIQGDKHLREKAIPFIFFSSTATEDQIKKVYDLSAQGFFEKPVGYREVVEILKLIVNYWEKCRHPKSFN